MSVLSIRHLPGALALASLFAGISGCSASQTGAPHASSSKTFVEVSLQEQSCMSALQANMTKLEAKRMDAFFSAALNGLVSCEASSGLAHVPTREVSRWLAGANGKAVSVAIPKAPRELSGAPATDDSRLPYQRACVGYMRRYVPASIARAGDDPDVAAAFTFNALEECDSDSGFATITPSDLAAIMQAKHLL